jgi:hypothetical protein
MRVYSSDDQHFRRESKFLTGDVEVLANSIRSNWSTFSFEEKLDFSLAFGVKPNLTSEDEKILDFLMEAGPHEVWCNLALLICNHSDRDRVVAFLIARIKEGKAFCTNYYQALAQLGDLRAIPALTHRYSKLRERKADANSGPLTLHESMELFDYLYCCWALLVLAGSREFEDAIREMVGHPDGTLSKNAEMLLASSRKRTK